MAPRFEFLERRGFLPSTISPTRTVPLLVRGEVVSSDRLVEVEASWDGAPSGTRVLVTECPWRGDGLHRYEVDWTALVGVSEGRGAHTVELRFSLESGRVERWHRDWFFAGGSAPPFFFSLREIGDFDRKEQVTPIRLRGAAGGVSAGDRLTLLREGEPVVSRGLEVEAGSGKGIGLSWFDIEEEVEGLPPGVWSFALTLEHEGTRPVELARWRQAVRPAQAVFHVEEVLAEPLGGTDARQLLRLRGWVESSSIVDSVRVLIDGRQVGSAPILDLHVEASDAVGEVLLLPRGFAAEIPLECPPGEYRLDLVAVQAGAEMGSWREVVDFHGSPSSAFEIESRELELLETVAEPCFWTSIAFRGRVSSGLSDAIARLEVDDALADECLLSDGREFVLRHAPRHSGRYGVRVACESRGRVLHDSGRIEVLFRRLEVPPRAAQSLERILERFSLRDLMPGDSRESVRRLAEVDPERLSELFALLGAADRVSSMKSPPAAAVEQEGPPHGSEAAEVPNGLPGRPLRVLFASWEVPCLRHGGGVAMVNLLKELGRRHRITVVHSYGSDQEGWVDDVRPWVERVVSVPRTFGVPRHRSDSRIPEQYHRLYIPELCRVLECEVLSGDYDLVDYEYTGMFSHIARHPTPRLLGVYEVGYLALLGSLLHRRPSDVEAPRGVLDFLRRFYFDTVALPRACRNLVTVTEEDAEALRTYAGRARIHVNTIGVDIERLRRSAPEHTEPGKGLPPSIAFMGTYGHPPNLEAARFLERQVLPELARRCPGTRLWLIGPNPLPEWPRPDQEAPVAATGFVDDFRPYLRRAAVLVAPLFLGTGMRVKILEAMACGTPVVGTELALRGLSAVPGRHYLRAETAAEFVEAARRCIEEPVLGRSLAHEAARLVEARHSAGAQAGRREAIWRSLLADRAEKRRGRSRSLGGPP